MGAGHTKSLSRKILTWTRTRSKPGPRINCSCCARGHRGYFSRFEDAFPSAKNKISRSSYLSEFHHMLRLPRKVTLELPSNIAQCCPCHEKAHSKSPCEKWDVMWCLHVMWMMWMMWVMRRMSVIWWGVMPVMWVMCDVRCDVVRCDVSDVCDASDEWWGMSQMWWDVMYDVARWVMWVMWWSDVRCEVWVMWSTRKFLNYLSLEK